MSHITREDLRVGAGSWTNKQYNFTCKPTTLTANPSDENYYRFRTSYNKWVKGPLDKAEKGPRGTKIGDTGRLQDDIWKAMFDLYEHNLRQELGEDEAGVSDLRGKLDWVDGGKKYLGYGEKHPTADNTPDGSRVDADRRVEVMLFDDGEEPDLAANNGEEIYESNLYDRKTAEIVKDTVEVQIRLCGFAGNPVPDSPYKATRMAFTSQGTTDSKGCFTLRVPGAFRRISLSWDDPAGKTDAERHLSAELELRVSDGEEALRRRLSNLGYQTNDRSAQELLSEFRAEFGMTVDDSDATLERQIASWHDGGDRPPRFASSSGVTGTV